VAASRQADVVVLGSYVTAKAIARAIKELAPEKVSLVAMGADGEEPTPEDLACADYIEHLLTGSPYDHTAALRRIIEHESTQKFLQGDREYLPPTDPIYCLQRDLFDFIIVARLEHGQLIARRGTHL
jgi:2-phosphosulfolactate phosphatase